MAKKPVERRPPLTDKQKLLMLSGLIRRKDATIAVIDTLTPETFAEGDVALGAVWAATVDHFRKFGKLPQQNILHADLGQRLAEDPDALGEDGEVELARLIRQLFRPVRASLDVAWTIQTAKAYLQERLVDQALASLDHRGRVPSDLGLLMSTLAQQSAGIESLTNVSVSEPFPENWTPTALTFKPTQVKFLDEMLNGGPAGNEVVGVVGPTKGGKTTLLNQLCISAGLHAYAEWVRNGKQGNPERSYFFSWEDALEPDLRFRAMGYAASIARETLEKGEKPSTANNLKPYEKIRYRSQIENGARVLGERERMDAVRKKLNKVWAPFDMTGADQAGDEARGTGYVNEVVRLIQADQQRNGNPGVALICIDYAGAMVDRHINHLGLPEDRRRQLTGKLPYRCRTQLAMRFKSPVILAHQLAAAENLKSSGHKQRSQNAAEAKSFPENCNHCFTMGTLTEEKLQLFCLDLSRRVKSQPVRVLRLIGELWEMKDVGDEYQLDHATRRIAPRRELDTMGDDTSSSPTVAERRTSRPRSIMADDPRGGD